MFHILLTDRFVNWFVHPDMPRIPQRAASIIVIFLHHVLLHIMNHVSQVPSGRELYLPKSEPPSSRFLAPVSGMNHAFDGRK